MRPTLSEVPTKLLLGLYLIGMSIACGGDPLSAPADENPARLYARLTLEHKAIVLSTHVPYDTVQLRAVPRNLLGGTLPDAGRVEYRRVNPSDTAVFVDSTGFVTVRMSTPGTRIEARLTIDGVTRTDTATLVVHGELPVRRVARMEFSPVAPDSNWRWVGNTDAVGYERWVRLFDVNGDPIPNSQVVVTYSWDNDLVVRSAGFNVSLTQSAAGYTAGEAYIRARVYAYGMAFSDSTLFRRIEAPVKFIVVGRELPANGEPVHRFYPDSLDVRTGTTIIFMNANGNLGSIGRAAECNGTFCGNRLMQKQAFPGGASLEWVDSTDVIFDRPDQVGAGRSFGRLGFQGYPTTTWPADGGVGDISAFALMRCVRTTIPHDGCGGRIGPTANTTTLDTGYRSRTFNTAGTYHFHSTRFPGAMGVIVVRD